MILGKVEASRQFVYALLSHKRTEEAYDIFETIPIESRPSEMYVRLIYHITATSPLTPRQKPDVLTGSRITKLFNEYRKNHKAESHVYNAVMSFYMRRGNYKTVTLIAELMREDKNANIDMVSYSIMINSAFKRKMVVKATKILSECQKKFSPLPRVIYINAASGFLTAGFPDKALGTYKEFLLHYKPRLSDYNVLLKILATMRSIDALMEVWDEMKTVGYDQVSFGTLMDAFSDVRNIQAAEKVFEYVTDHAGTEGGLKMKNTDLHLLLKDAITSANIITSNAGDTGVDLLKIDEAKLKSVPLYFWNTLLKTYAKSKQGEKALQVYSAICNHNNPDVTTLNTLLGLFAMQNDSLSFSQTLEQLSNRGYRVHDYTLAYMLKYHEKNGSVETIQKLAKLFFLINDKYPSLCQDPTMPLRLVLRSLDNLKQRKLVIKYYEMFQNRHLKPCPESSVFYINALFRDRQKKKLIECIVSKQLYVRDAPMVGSLYNRQLWVLFGYSAHEEFLEHLEWVLKKGGVPQKRLLQLFEERLAKIRLAAR
jgi:pentatricopeptide repeat protein